MAFGDVPINAVTLIFIRFEIHIKILVAFLISRYIKRAVTVESSEIQNFRIIIISTGTDPSSRQGFFLEYHGSDIR